jgi:hypothetical protein
VTIVGHASPRWRGAPTNKEADRLNEMLANKRAEAVRVEVERILHQQLGQDVRIEFNVSLAPEEPARDIEVGASGVGSRESITAAMGDRQKDDEYYRRVDVDVEMVTTDYRVGGRSLPSEPALSKQWRIKINELKLVRVFGSAGAIEIEITNKLTGKQFLATAKLVGVGRPKLNPFSKEEPTGNSRVINTDVPIGIQDFEGTEIAVNRVDAKVLVGESAIYITLPNLAPGHGFTMYHKFGIGMPSGYHVWGNLHVFGDPSDFYSDGTPISFPQAQLDKYGDKTDVINPTEEVTEKLVQRHAEGLILTFPTESYNLSASEHERLNIFITTWTNQLGRTTSPLTTPDPDTGDLSPAAKE